MCCNGQGNNANVQLGQDITYTERCPRNCPEPFAQVCISCPPPCPIPLCPCPVRPLQLPCPPCCYGSSNNNNNNDDQLIEKARNEPNSRYDNFYNNYNIDWHADGTIGQSGNGNGNGNGCTPPRSTGTTVDGKSPCCDDYQAQAQQQNQQSACCDAGCPTGFKPCSMKLRAPPCCSPCGVWCAEIQKCPPQPKKKEKKYSDEPCTRPCCLHWEDKGGPCLYDDPCKAHCFNHPPGIKPSGRFP